MMFRKKYGCPSAVTLAAIIFSSSSIFKWNKFTFPPFLVGRLQNTRNIQCLKYQEKSKNSRFVPFNWLPSSTVENRWKFSISFYVNFPRFLQFFSGKQTNSAYILLWNFNFYWTHLHCHVMKVWASLCAIYLNKCDSSQVDRKQSKKKQKWKKISVEWSHSHCFHMRCLFESLQQLQWKWKTFGTEHTVICM